MTNNNPAHVHFLLDETGSMLVVKDQTIAGFNEYLLGIQAESAPVKFTLTLFNDQKTRTFYKGVSIKDVQPLNADTYHPQASTNLYDAIGAAIRQTEATVADGEDVLFMIFTDGEENASREYDLEGIKALIKEKEAAGWVFGYMGANQDAWAAGGALGVGAGNVADFATSDMKSAYASANEATSNYLRSSNRRSARLFTDTKK